MFITINNSRTKDKNRKSIIELINKRKEKKIQTAECIRHHSKLRNFYHAPSAAIPATRERWTLLLLSSALFPYADV